MDTVEQVTILCSYSNNVCIHGSGNPSDTIFSYRKSGSEISDTNSVLNAVLRYCYSVWF